MRDVIIVDKRITIEYNVYIESKNGIMTMTLQQATKILGTSNAAVAKSMVSKFGAITPLKFKVAAKIIIQQGV